MLEGVRGTSVGGDHQGQAGGVQQELEHHVVLVDGIVLDDRKKQRSGDHKRRPEGDHPCPRLSKGWAFEENMVEIAYVVGATRKSAVAFWIG